MDKTSSLDDLRSALTLVQSECLNERVRSGKKWKNSIQRYEGLSEKLKESIDEKVISEYKMAKSVLRTAARLLKEGSIGNAPSEQSIESIEVVRIMNKKYPEIIHFFREQDNQAKLQQAANEYQDFARTYHRMQAALQFDHSTLDKEVFSKLKEKDLVILRDPDLGKVIEEARYDTADCIFFHADNVNNEVYNYSQQIY